jgi:hypothetical protein
MVFANQIVGLVRVEQGPTPYVQATKPSSFYRSPTSCQTKSRHSSLKLHHWDGPVEVNRLSGRTFWREPTFRFPVAANSLGEIGITPCSYPACGETVV